MEQPSLGPDLLQGMPALYFERTAPEERARHEEKLGRLQAEGGLLIDSVILPDGNTLFDLVTLDWPETGLLDRIFEAILRCHRLERGLSIFKARIFTGDRDQVVNLFELRDRNDRPLTDKSRAAVMERLREIHPGERGALETIRNFHYRTLIPLVADIPSIDNEVSEHYTLIDLKVDRISNRFTSVLVHFLARSELWLNIQVAEITQGKTGRFLFYVVDKRGRKLKDSNYVRQGLLWALEAMNALLTRFNQQYIRRDWNQRIEQNRHTIFHSRPRFEDYLDDLKNIRQLAELKGFENRLSHLVGDEMLDVHDYYFLKKVEGFVRLNLDRNRALVETPPTQEDVELCREYFEFRRKATRILIPLYDRLVAMPTLRPLLSPRLRLYALCRPLPQQRYLLDDENRLHLDGSLWLGEPSAALDPFLLMARTDCYLRADTEEAIEAALEGWNDIYIAENRELLGERFLAIIDEGIRQGNTAMVLRHLRNVGLLERFVPGFAEVQGRIHLNADHVYTVDEHSIAVVEVLLGLRLLGESLPEVNLKEMQAEYFNLQDAAALKNFARKYAIELRMLHRVPLVRNHEAVRPFFTMMEEARRNSLEYLMEVNLLEFGHETGIAALNEIGQIRRRLDPLIRHYDELDFPEQRLLVLAGLFHDLKKPAQDHDKLGADALDGVLEKMALRLPKRTVRDLKWIIAHHLDIRPLINRMGADGDEALNRFTEEAGDPFLVRLLILFTYADRISVHSHHNTNTNDAMVLGEMLTRMKILHPPA